jgi:PAS domain S-box-containing protein
MLGYTIDELQRITFREITHPDDMDISSASVRSLLTGNQDTDRFEKRYLHRNGSFIWVFVNTTLVRDIQNEPLYFITSLTNITERKQAEAAVLEKANALERFNNLMVGRELRMIELKQEINALCAQTGQPPRYALDFVPPAETE